jgi:hypothetical protein
MLQTGNLGKVTVPEGKIFVRLARDPNFAPGEVAEWSIAAVLKTVEGYTSGGSNPSLSAFLQTTAYQFITKVFDKQKSPQPSRLYFPVSCNSTSYELKIDLIDSIFRLLR